ncbi:MAG: winged helix-turn-helix transcriptional regulator [Erysipelotrichaceae bacterium]|nr:winged helix-turn-helix transcriptional regulator [Erysipelotrichaceae bacterium]
MTNKEREILELIKAHPQIKQGEIAKLLHISRSTVAVHISSLQRQGLIAGKGYIVNEEPYVLGIGAANVDVYGKSRIALRLHYDHPADISSSVGGVMHNIIVNYAKLGGKTRLISAYGDDSYGSQIVKDCEKNGIDISDCLEVKGHSSGVFLQVQDENNDMFLAICDMSILDVLNSEYIYSKADIITRAGLVVIDPSLKEEVIEAIIDICKDKVPVYIDPISDNYAMKMAPYAGNFELIKPNRSELASLTGMKTDDLEGVKKACKSLLAKGCRKVVTSLGKDGILYMDEDLCLHRRFKEEKKMVNASGAGDALMGALIYGQVNALEIEERIDLALAAGIAAIRSETTINENMSLSLLEEIIKEKKR